MGRRGLAPRPRDAAVRARVSKQRDLTMLNLEDLGMSETEPRRQPPAAIAAPASNGPVIASPIENPAGELNE